MVRILRHVLEYIKSVFPPQRHETEHCWHVHHEVCQELDEEALVKDGMIKIIQWH